MNPQTPYDLTRVGGLIGFGVIGLFVGAVILAVTYTMLQSWIRDDKGAAL